MDRSSDRFRVGMGWLCTYVICAVYGLSLVPGGEPLLLVPALVGVLALRFLKHRSRQALILSTVFSSALGLALRKMSYEPHGLTGAVAISILLIGILSAAVGLYVFEQERRS